MFSDDLLNNLWVVSCISFVPIGLKIVIVELIFCCWNKNQPIDDDLMNRRKRREERKTHFSRALKNEKQQERRKDSDSNSTFSRKTMRWKTKKTCK
ncbi:Hypothetical predicted protein [Cloeon dipterum]|uniref:Uncharacterized protein n=1 Tax=Cloeon dipterum TaxID=197152 RepID=A0A8S1DYK0_9INSE|nr:Hypothetical predicted protein [Cloeon dipterum]